MSRRFHLEIGEKTGRKSIEAKKITPATRCLGGIDRRFERICLGRAGHLTLNAAETLLLINSRTVPILHFTPSIAQLCLQQRMRP